MQRGSLIPLVITCASFFFMGCFPEAAAAQGLKPTGLGDLGALFKRPSVAVRLYRLEGPDSLEVGEEGRFAALANIEAASLPLRFLWDFGDGATASSLHSRHRFMVPGTYPVTFSISNGHSETMDTLFVTVVPSAKEEPTVHHAAMQEGRVKLAGVELNQWGHHLARFRPGFRMIQN